MTRALLMLTILLTALTTARAQTPDDLDLAVAARLQAHAAQGGAFTYRAVGRTVDVNAAGVVYLQHIDSQTGQVDDGVIDLALVALENGVWTVYLPGDSTYTSIYDRIPPDTLAEIDARPYKPAADPSRVSRDSMRAYRYPWANGAWATVTRSFNRHGLGQIDFDLGGTEIAAAKDGVIVYASDRHATNAYNEGAWWYWNVVIIEHAPYEYSLYGHILADSLPDWITAGCTDDFSAANCNVPVEAGDVIALEGNTGYSSNPHLHLELGQMWGIAAYRDTKDEDRDGDRLETVYAPYMYQEQNIGFRGVTPSDVASWAYGTVLQAYHGANAPNGQNIVRNGDFSAELDGWSASGQINWAARDGLLRFLRLNTADPPNWASFYQNLGYGADANTPFEVQIALGNDSPSPKTASVMLRNAAGAQYGAITCDFALPPGAPPTIRTLRGVTNATWSLLRLEVFINPSDGSSAALADNIIVMRRPDLALSSLECI
jgi:murein DD-endopeptidase MepM/ murein hydrolase activator NlpD